MIEQSARVGELKAKMINWMSQRGLGDEWELDRPDGEAIDFGYQYPVVEASRERPFNIFLKQRAFEISPSESWIQVSDRIVRSLGLPLGTLFRIYPVD
jgi:hypothetical protein